MSWYSEKKQNKESLDHAVGNNINVIKDLTKSNESLTDNHPRDNKERQLSTLRSD